MTKWIIVIFMGLVAIMAIATTVLVGRELLLDDDEVVETHLSDELMISALKQNADQYGQLLAMFQQDQPLKAVHPEWVEPKGAINEQRWNEYKKLFTALGLEAGMRVREDDSIWFINTIVGFKKGGSSKGYVYQPSLPTPQYPSLDTQPKEPGKGDHVAYKLINEPWYILYEWDQ